jgi:hypothetical protein
LAHHVSNARTCVRRDSHCRNHSQGSRFLQYTGIPSHTRDSFGKRPGKEGLIRC